MASRIVSRTVQGKARADSGQDRQIMLRGWAGARAAEQGCLQNRFRASPGQGKKGKAREVHGMTRWSTGLCHIDLISSKEEWQCSGLNI